MSRWPFWNSKQELLEIVERVRRKGDKYIYWNPELFTPIKDGEKHYDEITFGLRTCLDTLYKGWRDRWPPPQEYLNQVADFLQAIYDMEDTQ